MREQRTKKATRIGSKGCKRAQARDGEDSSERRTRGATCAAACLVIRAPQGGKKHRQHAKRRAHHAKCALRGNYCAA